MNIKQCKFAKVGMYVSCIGMYISCIGVHRYVTSYLTIQLQHSIVYSPYGTLSYAIFVSFYYINLYTKYLQAFKRVSMFPFMIIIFSRVYAAYVYKLMSTKVSRI
jgi:hypothetical protein